MAACATSSGVAWNDETVKQVQKGMTKAQVTAMLGEPSSMTTHEGDKEVWIFRRASDESGAEGKYVSFMTLGMKSGENAIKVDALSIMFTGENIETFKYEQNVDNNFTKAGGFEK